VPTLVGGHPIIVFKPSFSRYYDFFTYAYPYIHPFIRMRMRPSDT